MPSRRDSAPGPSAMVWTGRLLSALVVFFMIFDGVMKLFKPQAVVSAMAELGYPDDLTTGLGVLGLVCTFFYAVPRTAIFGAILLTGYFGGAISAKVRIEETSLLFGVAMGVIAWAGLYFRDARLRTLIPVKHEP
jgi:DoxX-like protein